MTSPVPPSGPSSGPTPVLLALTGSTLEPLVIRQLQQAEGAGVRIVRRCVDVADLVAAAA